MAVDYKKIAADWAQKKTDDVGTAAPIGVKDEEYEKRIASEKKGVLSLEDYSKRVKGYFLGGLMQEERDGSEKEYAESEDAAKLIQAEYEAESTAADTSDKLEDGWIAWSKANKA